MPSWPRLIGSAANAVDRAALAAARLHRVRGISRAESLPHEERLRALAWIRDAYGASAFGADPDAFFPAPEPVSVALRLVRDMPRGGAVWDASWPSRFEPYLEPVRAKYLAHERNRIAWARLFLGAKPRPAVIVIHGYLAGQWAIEELAWPLASWDRRGLDVAIAILPFHAVRGRTDRLAAPPFPGSDPRFSIEGFRQAIFDLRTLATYLRGRGASSIGIMGMSLGGYTTALLATVERELAFAVPIIPLASLADFAREQGRLGDPIEAAAQHRALEEAYAPVSPFTRPSRLAPGRSLVIAAERDAITPIRHAERLATHLDATLVRMQGGHLMQVGRNDAFRRVNRFLAELSITSR